MSQILLEFSDDSDGLNLHGIETVKVDVQPASNLRKIELQVDGKVVASSGSSPLAYKWDTTQISDGTHQVDAIGYYKTRRTTAHEAVTVNNNAPVPPPPPVPPSATDPSGIPMPDAPEGWTTIWSDDFNYNIESGAGVASNGDSKYFPGATNGKWGAYPWPWKGTPTWASYFPERTVSVHDSMLDIWLHDEIINGTRYYLIATLEPFFNGANIYRTAYRIDCMLKTDKFGQYHISNLLWPQSETWPKDGEIDWPEADFDSSSTSGFMHRQDATSGSDQDQVNCVVAVSSGWHKWSLEWVAGQYCTFFVDDTRVGSVLTSRVPNTPMRFAVQNGGAWITNPQPGLNGHLYYDWITVASK